MTFIMMAKYTAGICAISDMWNAQECGKVFKLKKRPLMIGWAGEGTWEFQNFLSRYLKTHTYRERVPIQDVEAALRDIPALQKHWLETGRSNPSQRIEDAIYEFIHNPEYTGILPDPDESFEQFLPKYQQYHGYDGVCLSPSQTVAEFALEWAKIAGSKNTILIGTRMHGTFSLYVSPGYRQTNVSFEEKDIFCNYAGWPEVDNLTRQHSPNANEPEVRELLRECLHTAAHIPDTGVSLEGRFESKFTNAGYSVLVFNPHEKY